MSVIMTGGFRERQGAGVIIWAWIFGRDGFGDGDGRDGGRAAAGRRGSGVRRAGCRAGAGAKVVRAMGMREAAPGGSVAYCAAVWPRCSGENRSPSQRVDSGLRRNDEKIGMTGKIGMTEKLRGKDDAGKGWCFLFDGLGVAPLLRRKLESIVACRFRLAPE